MPDLQTIIKMPWLDIFGADVVIIQVNVAYGTKYDFNT